MKPLLFSLLLLLNLTTYAQEPEPVYSFAKVKKPISWYKAQIKAWDSELKQHPKNALGWYYYYYANRNWMATDTSIQLTPEKRQAKLEAIVERAGEHIPDSYEYNLLMWKNHGFDMKYYPYLEKAFKLGDDRTEHLDYMMNIGEMNRDMLMRDRGAIRSYESGLQSTGMLYYNRNVLAGLEENAILFTVGDNDTYPIWVLQAKGFRKDVTVINTSLILIDDYRKRLFAELKIPEVKPIQDPAQLAAAVFKYAKQPVYVGLTAINNEKLISEHKDNLHLTGLAYQYCEKALDEKAWLKRNFEQRYTLDYIRFPLYQDRSQALVELINLNYIVPLLKLHEHYKTAGNLYRRQWTEDLLLQISTGTDFELNVRRHLEK